MIFLMRNCAVTPLFVLSLLIFLPHGDIVIYAKLWFLMFHSPWNIFLKLVAVLMIQTNLEIYIIIIAVYRLKHAGSSLEK